MLINITEKELDTLSEKAEKSPRKRSNLNYHEQMDDRLQRMIHAMHKGTYVQPHKHENPDKREAFIILRGRIAVVEFDEAGNVLDHIILDRNDGHYGVEIPARTWHCLIALENNSAVYEIKDGPYSPSDDKNFAVWAPKEGDTGCARYLENLTRLIQPE
ncbi:MAG: WbuC family cupin fold metalloprotein [Bacteroidales bacterium]|jgi:cupin fold WbuC family metalloprotein